MTTQPINLMATLKDLSRKGQAPGSKMAITIESDDLWFDPDDKPLARAIAAAIVMQIRDNLEQGRAPNGSALPSLSASTQTRREDETAQAARNGQAHERFKDNAFRYRVQANYERDYNAPRLGKFVPFSGGPRGVLSGMLLRSFVARPSPSGRGMVVYVAAKRGQPRASTTGRPAETKSALENVFAGVPLWTQSAMNSPAIRNAAQRAAERMLRKTVAELRASAKKLLQEIVATSQALGSFSDFED